MHSAEKKQVIKAIGDLGRRVTAADVATKTGLPLLVAQQELNRVASETNGHLQVGTSGDIVYSFTPGFSNTYLAKGMQAAVLAVALQVWAVLFYLLRISFGVMLILSLVLAILFIVAVCIALMFAQRGSSDNDRDGGFDFDWIFNGGQGFHFTFWDWMILRDILWWNSGPSRRYQPTYHYNAPTVRERPRSNFLLNCFSFLFGDGDPNEGLDEKRWQVIAQVIKRNNGVVTAEQLSPYTGTDPKDEDGVLPTLVRFNGRPEVTASGNIVYVFDGMQVTAADMQIEPPAYLQEFPIKFSTVDDGELLPVYIVAGLNLAAVYTAWKMTFMPSPLLLIPHLQIIFGILFCYGVAFIAIPLWRAVINAFINRRIDARNIQRFRYGQIAQHPSEELANKLVEARQYKLSEKKITEKDIVFTTEKDAREQDDELTDQFKELEKKKKTTPPTKPAAKPKQPQAEEEDEGRIINVAPDDDHVINIKKHAEEFDASP